MSALLQSKEQPGEQGAPQRLQSTEAVALGLQRPDTAEICTAAAAGSTRQWRIAESVRSWAVVAGAFLVTMVGYGAIYSYAAFAEDIADAFGSSRVSVSFVYALSGCTCFFVSALSGPLAARFGARVLAALGMLLVALGLAMAAMARSMVEVYAGYGVMVGFGCGFTYVPALAAVQRSFDTHRGLASGLALSGIGIGTALVPPATAVFAAYGDWRATFLACAGLAALVGLCGAALLPSASRTDAAKSLARSHGALPSPSRKGAFGLMYGGTLLVSLAVAMPHAVLVGTARDLGIGRHDALALLGLIGIGAILGRFVLGAVADLVGRRAVFLLCCCATAASMLVWAIAESEAMLRGFAFAFGMVQGAFVALLPAFVADSFGARALGKRLGLLYTGRGVALLAGPPALGLGIEHLSGHAWPLTITALLGLVGTALLAAVKPNTISPSGGTANNTPARGAAGSVIFDHAGMEPSVARDKSSTKHGRSRSGSRE